MTSIDTAAAAFHQHCAADQDGDALYLRGWTFDDWRALFEQAEAVTLRAGEVLIKGGETGRSLYFVESGALEVNAGGSGIALGGLLRELPGSVVGEISFFDGRPRTATVWAIEPTRLLRLDLDGLQAFAARFPERAYELVFALGRVLAFRLRRGERVRQPA